MCNSARRVVGQFESGCQINIDCARPPLARRTSCRRERKCGKHRQARAVQRTTSQHDNLPRLSCPRSRARCHRGPIATRHRRHPIARCSSRVVSPIRHAGPATLRGRLPKHPNDPPGTGFQEAETKGPKTLAAIDVPFSESGRSRITPPTRPISHAARNSPVAHDCVVGPRGLKLRARHAVLSNESPARPETEFRGVPRKPTNELKCRAATGAARRKTGCQPASRRTQVPCSRPLGWRPCWPRSIGVDIVVDTTHITEVAVARHDCLDKCHADTFIVGQARNQQ
jgi:hypothetical protein